MNFRDSAHDLPRKKGTKKAAIQKHKKTPASRMEPYPQEFLFSMQKLTFQREECKAKNCSCSNSHSDSEKRNKYNYANASGSPRRFIREARLKLHHSEKDTKHIIRSARLKLIKYERKSDVPNLTSFKKGATLGMSSAQQSIDFPLFGSNIKTDFSDFFILSCKEGKSSSSGKNKKSSVAPVKHFTGIRFQDKSAGRKSPVSHPLRSHGKNQNYELVSNCQGHNSGKYSDSAVGAASDEDQFLEKSCSQEARLDDMTVNELACYFDDFVHIPKKMSSMAEMMYT